ncbi:MAG: VanZ family protein [Polyangiaceae bacterium]
MTATYDTTLSPRRRVAFATQVVPAVAYLSVVFYAGLIRLPELPEVGFVATDKLLHTLVFGGLALLLARAWHWAKPGTALGRKLAFGAFGSSLLGLLLELCQAFVSYRSADVWDWVADTFGALLAVGSARLLWLAWQAWQRARG